MRHTLALLLIALMTVAAASAQTPSALRDITVEITGTSATITLLVSKRAGKVVVESKGAGRAQIRMKPMTAGAAALGSARLKPGIVSVKAHIERVDVLVTNVAFQREVRSIAVGRRDDDEVVVHVQLGDKVGGSDAPPGRRDSSHRSRATGATAGATSSPARRRWSLTTIVVDAGHGGKDPGAVGLDDVQEKDITLAVARRLRDELKRRMPGVTVVMTRDGDSFVELYRRGQIANERSGRLFISIHCNSMPEKPHPASGFECYILRPGKIEEAASVAAVENSAVRYEADRGKYTGAGAENEIIANMAQTSFLRYSEKLAEAIRRAMRSRTSLADRGVHQAGFYVLIGASMPSVLVEIGYVSNAKDVKTLTSTSGQKKIARALADGIIAYEKVYSASLH